MVARIIGARRDINFEDDKGRSVIGCKLFWAFKEEGVVGEMTEGKFFSSASPLYAQALSLNPGDYVQVTYGRNNRIDNMVLVDPDFVDFA